MLFVKTNKKTMSSYMSWLMDHTVILFRIFPYKNVRKHWHMHFETHQWGFDIAYKRRCRSIIGVSWLKIINNILPLRLMVIEHVIHWLNCLILHITLGATINLPHHHVYNYERISYTPWAWWCPGQYAIDVSHSECFQNYIYECTILRP